MASPVPQLALSALVAALVGGSAALLLRPVPVDLPAEVSPRSATGPGLAGARAETGGDEDLRLLVDRLAADMGALQAQVGRLAAERTAIGAEPLGERDGGSVAGALATADDDVLFEEVSRVLARIDEEKAAAARVEEMERRKGEERKAYAEFDEVQAGLGEALAKLSETMPMSRADRRDLEGLMNLQVERMRDLTRAWASGDFTDEEIAERFMAEREDHRRAASALLGEQRLGAYRKFIQDGDVGARYRFYTAPQEDWAESPER